MFSVILLLQHHGCSTSPDTCAAAAKEVGSPLRVQVTEGILTEAEAKKLISEYGHRATDGYNPSFGSASTYLREKEDVSGATAPLLRTIGARAAHLVAMAEPDSRKKTGLSHAEYPVITRYVVGESYGIHGDAAYLNRTHTVLIYLQAPAGGGGETVFPWWKKGETDAGQTASLDQLCGVNDSDADYANDGEVLRVKPAVGRAVMWPNLSITGHPDRRAFHGSCPVLLGPNAEERKKDADADGGGSEAKWVVQFWFDDKATNVWPEES